MRPFFFCCVFRFSNLLSNTRHKCFGDKIVRHCWRLFQESLDSAAASLGQSQSRSLLPNVRLGLGGANVGRRDTFDGRDGVASCLGLWMTILGAGDELPRPKNVFKTSSRSPRSNFYLQSEANCSQVDIKWHAWQVSERELA